MIKQEKKLLQLPSDKFQRAMGWYLNEEKIVSLNEIQRAEAEGFPKIDRAARIKSYAKFGYLAHFGELGEKGRFNPDRYTQKHEFGWDTPSGVCSDRLAGCAVAVRASAGLVARSDASGGRD